MRLGWVSEWSMEPLSKFGANLGEQRKLLVSVLDAVYIDTKSNLIVAVKPKPPFNLFSRRRLCVRVQISVLLTSLFKARLCFWWGRGRVELTITI